MLLRTLTLAAILIPSAGFANQEYENRRNKNPPYKTLAEIMNSPNPTITSSARLASRILEKTGRRVAVRQLKGNYLSVNGGRLICEHIYTPPEGALGDPRRRKSSLIYSCYDANGNYYKY